MPRLLDPQPFVGDQLFRVRIAGLFAQRRNLGRPLPLAGICLAAIQISGDRVGQPLDRLRQRIDPRIALLECSLNFLVHFGLLPSIGFRIGFVVAEPQ